MRPWNWLIVLAALAIGAGAAGPAWAEKRIALVIGNSAYQNAPQLPNPQNDARAMGATLERLGFEVEVAIDLDVRAMQQAFRDFGLKAEASDVAVIFYAGHGVQVAGENYILPVDARLEREYDLNYEALRLNLVMGEVAQARRLGLVILDACRDNPLAENLRRKLGPIRSREVGLGLARMDNPPSDTMIAFSTEPGEVAVDGEGQHSPYVAALLRHLEEPGLELNLLFRNVRDTVLELTAYRQKPAYFDSLSAEPFYFKEPKPNQRPVVAEAAALEVLDDAGPTPLGIAAPTDPDGDPLSAQVTGLPRSGVVAAGGQPVELGRALSMDELLALTFEPAEGVAGDAGSFAYLVKDERNGIAFGRVPILVTAANKPPVVATTRMLQLPAIPLGIEPPVDPDGDPLTITVVELPSRGTIRNGEAALEVGQELSAEELAGLVLEPAPDGAAGTFSFQAVDPGGASATSSLEINIPGLSAQPPAAVAAPAVEPAPAVRAPEPQVAANTRTMRSAPEPEPESPEAAAAPPEPTPEPAPEVQTAARTPPAEPAPAPAAEAGAPEPQLDASVAGEYLTVRASNVREGPGVETGRVATVPDGTRLRVAGQAPGRDWLQVELPDGRQGYIHTNLVEPAPVARAAEPETPPAAAPAPASPAAPAQPQMAQLTTGRTLAGALRDCPTCPELVPLPGGSFVMGSEFGDRSERPPRRVSVQPFALGRHEVTVGEWQACVAAAACQANPGMDGLDPSTPVHHVSWSDAQDYVAWLRSVTGEPYRLPSEAEWEYAARGGTSTRFWWGDEIGSANANCQNCGGAWDRKLPAPASSFPANPLGLHGMNGGVMEWVADCWFRDHSGGPADGTARSQENCLQRVLRGGSWRNDQTYATSSSRLGYDFDVRYLANGFRVARELN